MLKCSPLLQHFEFRLPVLRKLADLYGKNEDEGMKEDDALECGLKSFDIIGANYIPTEKEPNSKLVYNKKIMQDMEIIASNKKIDCVFTHWFGDVNTDHKTTWEISRTAFRNVKNFLKTYAINENN